jgi:hypothetical protein
MQKKFAPKEEKGDNGGRFSRQSAAGWPGAAQERAWVALLSVGLGLAVGDGDGYQKGFRGQVLGHHDFLGRNHDPVIILEAGCLGEKFQAQILQMFQGMTGLLHPGRRGIFGIHGTILCNFSAS